ncbi:hypothetical protein EC957_004257 [Mortierella hygrophila]|uniref:Uncharacterized protein n=1 Tax=Mortierella hygrophila TaxID=979708 RepID=A0A9P6K723_9FUNG|nr:hypothetical protein EC957_004257 [Mortierella hygrophila]
MVLQLASSPAFSSQTQKDKQLSYLRTIVKTIVRLAGFCSALYPILIVPTLRTKGLKDGFGGGTQYLTIVGLLVTMVCIGLGIAGDAFKQPGLIAAKNRILPMVVPVECVIAGLYWYLVLTDVFHIYPDGHKYLPFYIDIQMHGIPFLTGLAEMFFFSEALRIHRVKDTCCYLLFAVFYSSWSSFCAHMDGEWPYPVLQNQASDWERYSTMVNATMVGLAIHFIISEAHIRTTAKASQ